MQEREKTEERQRQGGRNIKTDRKERREEKRK